MQPSLFYEKSSSNEVIPLLLVNKQQWETDAAKLFSAHEMATLVSEQFQGELGESVLFHGVDGQLNKVIVGRGEASDAQALAIAATRLPGNHCYESLAELSDYAILSWSLAQYRFDVYKKQAISPRQLRVNLIKLPVIMAQSEAIFLIRDLINMPTNDLGPTQLAEQTRVLATRYKAKFKEWVGEELDKASFPAISAVGRAAKDEPRLLSFTWGERTNPRVTLIGKGVCFDSGGLDLKPANAMRLMKKDMGGAAHVLGLAQWIMETGLPIYLQVYIPAVENAVGSQAYRPGDILTMRNGLTVEIDNTDAEGRLVLADALVKACEEEPELVIDFATLTGAARVAVGTEIAAMFTPNNDLAMALQQSAEAVNDPVWRLPLFAGYQSLLESNVADLVNSSPSSYAGAITAALFLQRFVQPTVAWVHFDVMAWNVSSKPGKPEGGEAMGFRAVAHYLLQRYGNF